MNPSPPALLGVGQLARRTGLTVRTLHHYEAIGLLVPSARTEAGHRRYGASDVARLQQIVSLRTLGFGLDRIRALLDDGLDARHALTAHIDGLRRRLAEGQALLGTLEALAQRYAEGHAASTADLLHLIHTTTMFEQHYTPAQLDALQQRAQNLGPEALADVQRQWADLFAELDTLRTTGTPPDAPEAQALAARGQALIAQFTGGDAGIRKSLDAAVAASGRQAFEAWGISPDLGAYWQQVLKSA